MATTTRRRRSGPRRRSSGLLNGEKAMNRILTAAAIAAATNTASWAVKRWIDGRLEQRGRALRKPMVETWENEGGALAPHHAPIETSQVPR